MDIDLQKKELRKKIKELKRAISLEEKKERSKLIFTKLEKLDIFQKSETIMLYWSMNDEVHTHDFIKKHQKSRRIILPTVNGDELELKVFDGISRMKAGETFSILEPQGEVFSAIEDIDLIIVPGVAFDKQNNRLGRGRAYYDKLLKLTRAVKIGVCFNFQLFDEVPIGQFDIPMDLVVSE